MAISHRVVPRLALLGLIATVYPSVGGAQRAGTPPAELPIVEVDPIRCWWRTSNGAVRTGETFSLDLTCAVLENEAVQVVPDESRLGGNVVQMAPFEVVDSTHPPDLRSGQRRFFQYQYKLRVINPDMIGKDVPIPDTVIRYRVSSRLPGNASLQGRDLLYMLPPQSVRVLSMVPGDASDIRDASGQPFGAVDALVFRASVFDIVALTLVALGALMTIVALVRLVRGVRRARPAGERRMTEAALARLAGSELSAAQRDAEAEGWNEAVVGRALAASRVAGAVALGRPVCQRAAARTAKAGSGRLLRRDLRGRAAKVISSPVTAEDVARELARMPVGDAVVRRETLEDLQRALATFDRVLYGREPSFDRTTLDAALARAVAATRRLRSEHAWPKTYFRRWSASEAEPQGQT